MIFTVSKTPFAAGLSRIQGITSGRSTMPILANVLLQVTPLGHNGPVIDQTVFWSGRSTG